MENAEGNGIAPVHWDGFEQRVDVLPVVDGHENVIGVLALIEDVDAEKVKIHNVDLRMIPPKLVPHLIQIVVPTPANHQEVLPVKIIRRQALFAGQRVIDGYSTADWLAA